MAKFSSSSFSRFIIPAVLMYLGWYMLYDFFLKPQTHFDEWVIDSIVRFSSAELKLLGFQLIEYDAGDFLNYVGIQNSGGVTVGASCDGIVLFALFAIFITAFAGPVKHKLWYIPSGILAIHILNSFRVSALAWISFANEKWLAFNHDYTFTILVYAFVFLLWYLWVKYFAVRNIKPTSNTTA